MTVIVTGAAGGIGRACSEAIASHGIDVVRHDLPPISGSGLEVDGDLRDVQTLDRLAAAAQARGTIDGVVVAHGIVIAGTLGEIGEEASRLVMGVDFETVVALWDRFRPQLEASGGAFVVVVSQVSLVAEKGNGIYSAAKAAVRGWLRALEGETSVRVRLIHPGGVETPLLHRALDGIAEARHMTFDELVAERYAHSPARRTAQPSEIGEAAAWALELETPAVVDLAITGGEVLH
jgi:NAD(P)-dependent dehydrogenase (short-subunit alcohol dehydrogenase family)